MVDTLYVMPDSIIVLRSYLLEIPEITVRVEDRISTKLHPAAATQAVPALRLTNLSTVEEVPRAIDRVFMQIDCFDTTDPAAHLLARTVAASLRASSNYVHPNGILAGCEDVALRPIPDDTVKADRWTVTSHIYLRPGVSVA